MGRGQPLKASEQDNATVPAQTCFGKMDLPRHGDGDRETKAKTKPLRNHLQLQPLKMCSSTDRGQASVERASWSPRFSPKDAVWVPHPENTALAPAGSPSPWS